MSLFIAFANHIRKIDPSFALSLHFISVCDLLWRKLLVSICQVGQAGTAFNLRREFLELGITRPLYIQSYDLHVKASDLTTIFDSITSSQVKRSIAWMFCRTLPQPSNSNMADDIWFEGFMKEFHASQIQVAFEQKGNYSELFGTQVDFSHKSWFPHVQFMAANIANRLQRQAHLYPKVNRVKNVSQDSGHIYQLYHPEVDFHSVTSKDLEVHYGHSGFMIPGACEMRAAWRFNDLKPRVYYAQGGRDYFASRYMKRIAKIVMDSIPATEVEHRKHFDHYLVLEETDTLMYWDFTSFTTSLFELRFFLFYLAQALSREERGPVMLFDYHKGTVHAFASEMLHQYNEEVNINAPFTIHRLLDKFSIEDQEPDKVQANNGMLGVAGNIGFSTALHGYTSSQIAGTRKTICVGDDAVAALDNTVTEMSTQLQKLGVIHVDKFSILPPYDGHPQIGKFLKRALIRIADEIKVDFLFDSIPIGPTVDDNVPPERTVFPQTLYERRKKVSSQVGACLWDLYHRGLEATTDQDLELLQIFFSKCYKILGLPMWGAISGFRLDETIQLYCVPPIIFKNYDPRLLDWLEYQIDNSTQVLYSVPLEGIKHSPRDFEVESVQVEDRFWSAMEDLGYIKIEKLTEIVEFLTDSNRRRLRRFLTGGSKSGFGRLVRLTKLRDLPDHFHPFVEPLEEVHIPAEYIDWD